jgi:hypothetical protein
MILESEVNAILTKQVLSEERGVAAGKYGKVCEEIVDYCNSVVSTTPKMSVEFKGVTYDYRITVPSELTEKIDFIEDLDLKIYLKPVEDSSFTGGGQTTFKRSKHFNGREPDSKLEPLTIIVYGDYGNSGVVRRTVLNSLYHELNHCYDAWSRKESRYGSKLLDNLVNGNREASRVFSHDQNANTYFNTLFYRLFIPTELNAMCSGVYGDLRGFNANRENFRDDIKRTQAGFLLNFLTDNFDAAVGQASIKTLMDTCLAMDIDGISMKDQRTFLVTFKGVVEKMIRHAWKSVGRAASLWYDHKEDTEKEKMEDISI